MKDHIKTAILVLCFGFIIPILLISIIQIQSIIRYGYMHEYQVEIEMDSAHVYQYGRYVGSYKYQDSLIGFENIIAEDNK